MSDWPEDDETQFLNVDLDVWSRSPLDQLVAAFGRRVRVLFVGREGRRYGAHVGLSSSGRNVDTLVRALARLVADLPKTSRTLWDRAQSREFNIGIQAGHEPHSHELRLKADTLEAVARLNARIVVTTYAAQRWRKTREAKRSPQLPAREMCERARASAARPCRGSPCRPSRSPRQSAIAATDATRRGGQSRNWQVGTVSLQKQRQGPMMHPTRAGGYP